VWDGRGRSIATVYDENVIRKRYVIYVLKEKQEAVSKLSTSTFSSLIFPVDYCCCSFPSFCFHIFFGLLPCWSCLSSKRESDNEGQETTLLFNFDRFSSALLSTNPLSYIHITRPVCSSLHTSFFPPFLFLLLVLLFFHPSPLPPSLLRVGIVLP